MPDSTKSKNVFWWIASIAVSVLCCAVLFILFACYLSDVKSSVKDNEDRIAVVQERQDRILAEIEMIRKQIVPQPDQAVDVQAAPAGTDTQNAMPIDGVAPAVGGAPSASPVPTTVTPVSPAAPATVAPGASVPPASTVPNGARNQIQPSVPAVPAPSDKK